MLDITHGRQMMDKLHKELSECFTAPVFDQAQFAAINQKMERLLRLGITGTPVEGRIGRPLAADPTPAMLAQRRYRHKLAAIRRANRAKRQQNTGNPANPEQA